MIKEAQNPRLLIRACGAISLLFVPLEMQQLTQSDFLSKKRLISVNVRSLYQRRMQPDLDWKTTVRILIHNNARYGYQQWQRYMGQKGQEEVRVWENTEQSIGGG